MAHRTKIGGTAYEISGGRTLVDGTAYSIAGGRTLVDGTGYDISLSNLPPIGTALNDMTWEEVRAISDAGVASNYFSIGDTKEVTLSGNVGKITITDTQTVPYMVYIIGIDHNASIEGSGITFGTFRTADGDDMALADELYDFMSATSPANFAMNETAKNAGGWLECTMRTTVLGSDSNPLNPTPNTLLAALPADIRAVMKPMKIASNNVGNATGGVSTASFTQDYLPLLAEFEVMGVIELASTYEKKSQKQYEYYAIGNSPEKCYKKQGAAAVSGGKWWLRSATQSDRFSFVLYNGNPLTGMSANISFGIAPIFRV